MIVVNDTNIFIDLLELEILDLFFTLPIQIHTTEFVIREFKRDKQKDVISSYIDNDKLKVKYYTFDEVDDISNFQKHCDNNVTLTDCSVCLLAQQNNYTLLTGDAKLRKVAIKEGVKVWGIIKVFDLLIEDYTIIPKKEGVNLLERLLKINNRLPINEIQTRINKWKK